MRFNIAMAKGEFGEKIVRSYLERIGFVVYRPTTDRAHAFDIMAIKDKERCVAIDVKAKARRNKYPDTGIDERHYSVYSQFSQRHFMPFWLFFVDEMEGRIYGNRLEELNAPTTVDGRTYPQIYNGTRYWPIKNMRTIHSLTAEEIAQLKEMSQRSYGYEPEKPEPELELF